MSKPTLKTQIRSAIRKIWMWSDLRKEAKARARVSRGVYRCSTCKKLVGPNLIEIDHVIPATPPGGINHPRDWGEFIDRLLYCEPSNLVGICKPCHAIKTQKDKDGKKKVISKKTKRTKRLRKTRVTRIPT